MQRIDRYIIREILTPALIALATLTFVFFATRNGALLEIIIRQLATASELWAVVSAYLPSVLAVTLPMGLLVGVLTGFGRMSSDSETIALRASGVSMMRLLRPVLLVAFVFAATTMALTVWVAPRSVSRFNAMREQLAAKAISLELQPGVFNERLPGRVTYATEITTEDGIRLRKMMMAEEGDPEKPQVTFAESGTLIPDEAERRWHIRLTNANKLEVSPDSPDKDNLSILEEVSSEIRMGEFQTNSNRDDAEMSTRELWEKIKAGTATEEQQVSFHQRLAMPFSCFALALIAFPLGVSTSRGGKSVGLVLSLVLMLIYYLAFIGGSRLAAENTLPPLLGTWIPNVGSLVLGLILLSRSEREYDNRILSFVSGVIESLARQAGRLNVKRSRASVPSRARRYTPKYFRLLDVYVLRGFFFYLAIVLTVFVSLFIIVTLFELLAWIVRFNTPTSIVVLYFVFLLPQILYWVVPLAVLLAILITLGTLTKTNEVMAVKAGAVSLYRLSLPLIVMGAVISGAIYIMQDFVLPYTNRRQDAYRDVIRGMQPQTYSDPGKKWMKGSDDGTFVRIYYYALFQPNSNVFGNISVFDVDTETFALRRWTFAKRASWKNDGWTFEQGWARRVSEDRSLSYTPFESMNVSMDTPEYFKKEVREADQMNYMELRRYVAEFRESGFDVTRLTLDLYRKLSFPMVSFIMAIIGVPFSFKTGRKGAFYGIGLCVAVGLTYWSMMELFDKLGGINRLEPFIAAWFPNFIFGAGGLWMLLRVKT